MSIFYSTVGSDLLNFAQVTAASQVAPPRCASAKNKKFFLHFPKQFPFPVAQTRKKSVVRATPPAY
jgi:hypothetical protein